MRGGEVFVPKIPSMKVTDLARTVAPGAKRQIIGIRPGEKMDEVLLTAEESSHSLEFNNYYIVCPEHDFWDTSKIKGGKQVTPGLKYSSDNNSKWLTPEELKKMIGAI